MRGNIRARRGPRGTSHQLTVYAGRDEQGRDRYVRETVRGPRRDADRRLAQLVADVDAGRRGPTKSMRVAELVDAWWDAATGHLSPHTRIGYRGMLTRYVLPTFGKRRIDKLEPVELERWYARLVEGTATTSDRPLSPLTVRKVHTLLSGIFSTAVRWGWLPTNTVARARPPRAVVRSFQGAVIQGVIASVIAEKFLRVPRDDEHALVIARRQPKNDGRDDTRDDASSADPGSWRSTC
jgi:hypothetical protein